MIEDKCVIFPVPFSQPKKTIPLAIILNVFTVLVPQLKSKTERNGNYKSMHYSRSKNCFPGLSFAAAEELSPFAILNIPLVLKHIPDKSI